MKNQELNNSAQKSSALKFPIKKNSMGSNSNQAQNFNSNINIAQKEQPFLLQKQQFQPVQFQQNQMSDLPAINPGAINPFMNRPFSEDTQNLINKSEGKKTSFNRKNTIQQKQSLQQQMQQNISQSGQQQQQQPQTFPKIRSQIVNNTSTNLGDSSATDKGGEEQERRQQKQGYVEKLMLQIKNSQAKDTEMNCQSLLINSNQNSLKVNKFQSPAINLIQEQCLNSYNQTDSQQNKKRQNQEDQEIEEIEQFNKDDTYQYSDESQNSPIKQKFQLSSSDASNGNYSSSNNGKSINLLQQKRKESQSNNSSSEEQLKQNMKNIIQRVDQMGKDDSKQQFEERKTNQLFDNNDNINDQITHTKTIRERLSLPEKNKDINPSLIKEIIKSNSFKESSHINNDNTESKIEVSQQKIIKWKSGDFIGAGSFGQVFTAMNCITGEIFVVKKIMVHGPSKLDKEFLDEQEKELRIMQTLSHKHIIQYKGHERQQDCLCIFLEYMSEGNIDQMLKKFGALEEQTIKVYARQILSGIEYLHSQKVIHKDIKGANILVGSDGIVKLSDFGCAKQLELTLNSNKEMNKTLKGSVPWMSPEIVTQVKYDTKADIWSFGCTILEMASAEAPWSDYQFDNPIAAIMKIGLSNEIPKIPENISEGLNEFIKKCLQRDPENRPTATQLLNDPFLAEIN